MLFLIFDNAIAGTTTQVEGLPNQFEAIEGPDMPLELVYWDGQAIKLKPPQPSETAYWNPQAKEWQEPQVPVPTGETEPNWTMLIDSLRNSPQWGRAFAAACITLKANTAFTTLMATLSGLHSIETLEFAIARLREEMTEIAEVGDFSADEITELNHKLSDAGFNLQLS
jgi:hypothetical protein